MPTVRLLLVDDERDIATYLIEVLKVEDVEVVYASSGFELPLDQGPFDVAVIDLLMPGGGGEGVARQLIEESPKTKRILWTAIEPTNSLVQGVSHLFDAAMFKPIDGRSMVAKIMELVNVE